MAVLFVEFCDFDEIVKSEKNNLIPWLDLVFREFDKISSKHQISKIEVTFLLFNFYIHP